VQAKGTLRAEVKAALRTGRVARCRQGRGTGGVGRIKDMVALSRRPVEAADRAVPGFGEGDLLLGRDGASQIATLVERTSRYVLLVRVPYDRSAERVARLLAAKMNTLPELFKTASPGTRAAKCTGTPSSAWPPTCRYFCDPRSPWQRGTNENTNGLLRQYFPKRTDLSGYTQQELDAVADELNDRPRQTLDFLKPTEVFNQLLLDSTTGALTN
jgi:IS30 family transposase